jgi:hypothetical protein
MADRHAVSHHMVDVVSGGYPLGKPLSIAIDWARPEKVRVVLEPADQLGVAAAQSPHWKLNQLLEHFCSTSHHFKAPYRIDPLGAIDHVLDQIGYLVKVATIASNRC